MLRAMLEWCADNGLTPHLVVHVDENTRVPQGYVKNGEIVFNVHHSAVRNLLADNEAVTFSARFGGVAHEIYVPMSAVTGVFARENGQGLFFDTHEKNAGPLVLEDALPPEDHGPGDIAASTGTPEDSPPSGGKRPVLRLVK